MPCMPGSYDPCLLPGVGGGPGVKRGAVRKAKDRFRRENNLAVTLKEREYSLLKP